jgi:N-acetyl-anhydromuramyl-L-alanine amidase AmpD
MNKKIIYIAAGIAVIGLLSYKSWQPIDIVNELATAPQNGTYATRPLSQIDTIVVHHSAVPSTAGGATPQGYAQFHTTSSYYMLPGIAYQMVIQPDGKVYLTNYLETVAAHTGTLNPTAVGIVLSGDFDSEPFTKTQEDALVNAIKWVQRKVGKKLKVGGHYQFSTKTCPDMNVRAKLDEVVQRAGAIRYV